MKIYTARKNSSKDKILDLAKRMLTIEKKLNPEEEWLHGFPTPNKTADLIRKDIKSNTPFEQSYAYAVKEYLDDTRDLFIECDHPDDPSDSDWKYTWKYLHEYEKLYQELLDLMGYSK